MKSFFTKRDLGWVSVLIISALLINWWSLKRANKGTEKIILKLRIECLEGLLESEGVTTVWNPESSSLTYSKAEGGWGGVILEPSDFDENEHGRTFKSPQIN